MLQVLIFLLVDYLGSGDRGSTTVTCELTDNKLILGQLNTYRIDSLHYDIPVHIKLLLSWERFYNWIKIEEYVSSELLSGVVIIFFLNFDANAYYATLWVKGLMRILSGVSFLRNSVFRPSEDDMFTVRTWRSSSLIFELFFGKNFNLLISGTTCTYLLYLLLKVRQWFAWIRIRETNLIDFRTGRGQKFGYTIPYKNFMRKFFEKGTSVSVFSLHQLPALC
jgi:hypothetical protein